MREKLRERQAALRWSDGQMATALDIPRTTYSALKLGRIGVSLRMARKIVRAFPDLEPYVWLDTTASSQPQKPGEAA